MTCPFCKTEIHSEAWVCPTCKRDIQLVKELERKISNLEDELAFLKQQPCTNSNQEVIEVPITSLQNDCCELSTPPIKKLRSFFLFGLLPIVILLIGHILVTIIYDAKLIYLRILSISVPAIFGYILMLPGNRALLPWIVISSVSAILSVLGMSFTTHIFDGNPVLPQSPIEWREFIEYGISIASSYLAGMILGHPSLSFPLYLAKHSRARQFNTEGTVKTIKILNDNLSVICALVSTSVSIYTGLKTVL